MIYDPANPAYMAVVQVVEIRGDKVRLGIIASREVSVHRREVFDAIQGKDHDNLPIMPARNHLGQNGQRQVDAG